MILLIASDDGESETARPDPRNRNEAMQDRDAEGWAEAEAQELLKNHIGTSTTCRTQALGVCSYIEAEGWLNSEVGLAGTGEPTPGHSQPSKG